ncbi:MAG: hypothetical protein ACUVRM_07640 [Bacillota bacterium]
MKAKRTFLLTVISMLMACLAFPLGAAETPRAVPVNLEAAFNFDVVSTADDPMDGDFTGNMDSMGNEGFPNGGSGGEFIFQGVPFLFATITPGDDNAVVCVGQQIHVRAGNYAELYVAGAAQWGDREGVLNLGYTDGSAEDVKLFLTDWTSGNPAGGNIRLIATKKHNTFGVTGDASIWLARIPVNPDKKLHRITLPDNAFLKIFAITAVTEAGLIEFK